MSMPLIRQGYYPKDDDYYILLDVDFNASQETIVSAYRNLARRFHPDKHVDDRSKREAELIFRKIKTAYDVLSDPRKRKIYDTLGPEGLKIHDWQLTRKQMTAEEIREEFLRIQKQLSDAEIAIIAKPRSSFSMAVDASEIFRYFGSKNALVDPELDQDNNEQQKGHKEDDDGEYEEELEVVTLGDLFYPISAIETRSLEASMSVDNDLGLNHTVTLTGSLSAQNGLGGGIFKALYKYKYSPSTKFKFIYQVGMAQMCTVGVEHTLTERTSISCRGTCLIDIYDPKPTVRFSISHKIRDYLMGKLTYQEGHNPSVSTSLIYINKKLMLEVTTTYMLGHVHRDLHQTVSMDVGYRFNNDDSKISISLGLDDEGDLAVEYGCETRVFNINLIGASLALSVPSGITLKLRYNRANQEFVLPIYLSDEIHSSPVFYGTMVPLVAYYVAHRYYLRHHTKKVSPRETFFT